MVEPDSPGTGGSTTSSPAYWTKARLETVRWLRDKAPPLADVYEGAVELSYGHRVPGWTRFVCHAMREIGNRLSETIVGPAARTKTDARHAVSTLAEAWLGAGYSADGVPPGHTVTGVRLPTNATIPVSLHIVQIAADIVRDHELGCDSRRNAADQLFRELTPEREHDRARLRFLADEWHKIMRWAVGRAHVSSKGNNEPAPDLCQERFEVFQTILGSLVCDFFTSAGEIDEILEAANA